MLHLGVRRDACVHRFGPSLHHETWLYVDFLTPVHLTPWGCVWSTLALFHDFLSFLLGVPSVLQVVLDTLGCPNLPTGVSAVSFHTLPS